MHKNVAFHNGNLNPDIIEYQKKVFDHFGIKLEQVETTLPHPEAIDHWLDNNNWGSVTVWDIDCIPLNKEDHEHAIELALDGVLYGCAQQANHIKGTGIYIGPFCISFSHKTFTALGRPSFLATTRGDVGAELTWKAIQSPRVVPLYQWPVHVHEPKWDLGNSSCFGLGTTYQGGIYHAFESRMGNGEMFIKKCKEVLGEK